jgi:branched-chain amino acid transport system permease protein
LPAAASACAGAAAEWGVFRPLRDRGATAATSLLASLGLYVVVQSLISLAFGAAALSLRSGEILEGMSLFDVRITVSQIWIAIAGVIGCSATWLLLQHTLTGKLIRAVGCDWELAHAYGCNRDRVVMWAFVIGSALAGLTGILVAYDTSLTPFMGFQLLLGGVVAVVIGGVGNIVGIALGAILLSTAQHLVNWWISSAWQDVLVFAIMVLFLLLRPQGFLGTAPRRGSV